MTDSRAAVGMDRLPWLTDEPAPRPNAGGRELLGWAFAAILLVAAVSYWMGMNSVPDRGSAEAPVASSPPATVRLPEARPAEPPRAVVAPAPLERIEPVAAPPTPAIAKPGPETAAAPARRIVEPKRATAKSSKVRSAAPAKVKKSAKSRAKPTRRKAAGPPVWPVRVVDGASGRLVRIGTFSTARQAKKGWWAVMRAYPGMQRLPALVVPVGSLRDGRVYYRLQMGTTSQAHSEVLCQRMRIIGQSCVVIGVNRQVASYRR